MLRIEYPTGIWHDQSPWFFLFSMVLVLRRRQKEIQSPERACRTMCIMLKVIRQ